MPLKNHHNIPSSYPSNGYSSCVRIRLHVDGQIYRVAQIGGGRIYFDAPVTFAPTTGMVVVTIDDEEERWEVEIPAHPEPTCVVAARIQPN